MPIYEFYCDRCNTIYKFFSRTVHTNKIPRCPKCDNDALSKRVSSFATISGKKDTENPADSTMPQFDESKMERAMAMLAKDAGKINEDDPRQAAQFMRKLTETAGMNLTPTMEEAFKRMERGEDPEKIEEEMGDLISEEEPLLFETAKKSSGASGRKPAIDQTIYDM